MISYKWGSILTTRIAKIVCPVSLDGVISNKLTQTLLLQYPQVVPEYVRLITSKSLQMGQYRNVYVGDRMFCLFPVKEKHNDPDSYDYIIQALKTYNKIILLYEQNHKPLTPIAFPQLGIGDIEWRDVQIVMEQFLDELNQEVYIYCNKGDRKIAMDKRKR